MMAKKIKKVSFTRGQLALFIAANMLASYLICNTYMFLSRLWGWQ